MKIIATPRTGRLIAEKPSAGPLHSKVVGHAADIR